MFMVESFKLQVVTDHGALSLEIVDFLVQLANLGLQLVKAIQDLLQRWFRIAGTSRSRSGDARPAASGDRQWPRRRADIHMRLHGPVIARIAIIRKITAANEDL
jgi:hypothetical protein